MNSRLNSLKNRFISVAVWMMGLTIFIPLGLFAISGSFFTQSHGFIRMVKAGCRLLIRCLFIRVQVEGREQLESDKTYLFIANHVNILDVFILYGFIPNHFKGVELEDHFNWPFYGAIIRRLGMIPISHKRPRAALKSLQLARETLAQGISIVILPEGGRSLNGEFRPFKRGSFILAKKAAVDIVPVVMVGAYQINHKGSLLIRPGKMILRFGTVIPYQSIQYMDVETLKNSIHQKMIELFKA